MSYLEPRDLAAESMLVWKEWCQKGKPYLFKWYSQEERTYYIDKVNKKWPR